MPKHGGPHARKGFVVQNRVRELREDRGMSMRELAELIGTSHATISTIEACKVGASDLVKIRLSKVFGVPVHRIFDFTYNPNETQGGK